jgi:lipopolysaccharide transport system ATP-binding protein
MAHIIAKDLVIDFPVYNVEHRSLKRALLRATSGGRISRGSGDSVVVRAIDNISFEIQHGERIGLAGHNGSGKTTLLRVLAGIYSPVSGVLEVDGKIGSLLDLDLGIDPEVSGYENILMRGIVAGFTPKEINSKADEIADFSGLGEYLEMPVRTYSSGMRMRLAFSISTCIEADILLMDEWLSAGDANFVEQSTARLMSLIEGSRILIIASHSHELLHSLCNRVIHLEAGKIVREEIITPVVPI